MSGRGHAYLKMVLKNILLFVIAFMIISSVVTLGKMRLEKKELQKEYFFFLTKIQKNPAMMEQARALGMNESQYAWYLAYRRLDIKPTFKESLRYYLGDTRKMLGLHGRVGSWSTWFFLRNSFSIIAITGALTLTVGLYLGLKAGYDGGILEKAVSTMAMFFSAIPAWFIGALIFLEMWNTGHIPSFWMNFQHLCVQGESGWIHVVKYYIPPAVTLFLVTVWEYAFIVSTMIKGEKGSYHVLADVSKGLPDGRIQRKLLRVVLPSFMTYTTYNFIDVLMNLLVIEIVFGVPGLGYLLRWSFRVVPKEPKGVFIYYTPQLVIFVSLVILLMYTVNSILMEGLYIYLDPRVSRRD